MRRFSLALALAVALTGTTAHAQSPGGHLRVLSVNDIGGLDPSQS